MKLSCKIMISIKTAFNLIILKARFMDKLQFYGFPVTVKHDSFNINNGVIRVGRRVNISKNTEIIAVDGGRIDIGDNVYFGKNSSVVSRDRIIIGNRCRFGPNVSVYDHNHVFTEVGVVDQYRKGTITIGNNCWLSSNVVVLKGVTIGDGCIIGAGAIISKDVPAHSLVKTEQNNSIELIVRKED